MFSDAKLSNPVLDRHFWVFKGLCHEMVRQLRPFLHSSFGLKKNSPRISLPPGKSRDWNLWCNKQGNCLWKIAGTGAGISHLLCSARKYCGSSQTNTGNPLAIRSQVECGLPSSALSLQVMNAVRSEAIRSHIDTSVWGTPQYEYFILGNPRSWHCGLPQSAPHIWARNLARAWIPAPAILNRDSPCLLRLYFLMCDFSGVKLIRGECFRPKLATNSFGWQTISWHYTFKPPGGA
jgi:hypothetical protein